MYYIYLCGPTVYDYPHLGNLRPVVTLDFLLRSYRSLGEKFYYVQNITDIDDKIIEKSIKERITEKDVSKKYTQNYLETLKKLNIIMPDEMPTVSNNIDNIILFIKELIISKSAYVVEGNVYFNIKSTRGYGDISNQKLDKMLCEPSNMKINPQDFVLWKKTQTGITWDSPWSKGRPGWHTECAAFINKHFNSRTINIHAGGVDLKFPHHENENIQYIALNNKKISEKWYHFGHLFIDDKKMSKSLKNILRADKFIDKYGANIFKILFLLTNPMSPMSINDKLIHNAKNIENKLAKIAKLKRTELSNNNKFANFIINLNFAQAMSFLHEQLKDYNRGKILSIPILQKIIDIIGLKYISSKISPNNILLLEKWKELRDKKNYIDADKLREKLKKLNIIN